MMSGNPLIPQQPSPEEFDAQVAAVFGWDDTPSVAPAAEPEPPSVAEPAQLVPAAVPSAAEPTAGVPSAPVAPAVVPPVTTEPANGLPAETLPPLEPQKPVVADPEAERNLQFANMQAQLAAAQAELARVRQEPPAAAPQPTVPSEQPEQVSYALTIPDEVFGAIFHEDAVTSKKGMEHLVNSLATVIHNKVRADYSASIQRLETTITAREQQEQQRTVEQQRETMQQQYFERFPDHNKPVLRHILYAQAQALASEYPTAPVDDNYFNALGTRVNAAIAEITGAPAPTPVVPAVPAIPPKPAAMMPTAARASVPVSPSTNEALMETLFQTEFD
jgi:hypothetical protein